MLELFKISFEDRMIHPPLLSKMHQSLSLYNFDKKINNILKFKSLKTRIDIDVTAKFDLIDVIRNICYQYQLNFFRDSDRIDDLLCNVDIESIKRNQLTYAKFAIELEISYNNSMNNHNDETDFLANEGKKATHELLKQYNVSYESKLEVGDSMDQYYLFKKLYFAGRTFLNYKLTMRNKNLSWRYHWEFNRILFKVSELIDKLKSFNKFYDKVNSQGIPEAVHECMIKLVENSMDGKPNAKMETVEYYANIKSMYRVFFKYDQKKYKMFLKSCNDDWFKENNLGPVIKSLHCRYNQDYRWSPSVDRCLGLLNNDGMLDQIHWKSIVSCLKVPRQHKFSVDAMEMDEE